MEMAQSPAAFAIVTAATVSLCSFNFFFFPPKVFLPPLHAGSLLPHCVRHSYKWREPLPGTGYHLHSNNSVIKKIQYKNNKRSFSVASISKNDLNFHKTMFIKLLTPQGHVWTKITISIRFFAILLLLVYFATAKYIPNHSSKSKHHQVWEKLEACAQIWLYIFFFSWSLFV